MWRLRGRPTDLSTPKRVTEGLQAQTTVPWCCGAVDGAVMQCCGAARGLLGTGAGAGTGVDVKKATGGLGRPLVVPVVVPAWPSRAQQGFSSANPGGAKASGRRRRTLNASRLVLHNGQTLYLPLEFPPAAASLFTSFYATFAVACSTCPLCFFAKISDFSPGATGYSTIRKSWSRRTEPLSRIPQQPRGHTSLPPETKCPTSHHSTLLTQAPSNAR